MTGSVEARVGGSGASRPEPLHLDSRESAAKVERLFESFVAGLDGLLGVLEGGGLTRFERAWLATKILQHLSGYGGRKPRDGDSGRPVIVGVAERVRDLRSEDIRVVVAVDGSGAGLTDLQARKAVGKRLDLSPERLRQILTGDPGLGRRRERSDRPAGRPRRAGSTAGGAGRAS